MDTINVLIPVRSGSLRVANKNIRPFCNTTLLENKINTLKRVNGIDNICVNSNDYEMLKIAERNGAIPISRDQKYASNHIEMSEVYWNMALAMNSEHILCTHVTNPIVSVNSYEAAIKMYFESTSMFDSLNTMSPVKEFLWLDGEPMNYDPKHKPRSQDLPNIQSMNAAISIIPRELMIQRRSLLGEKPQVIDIGQLESFDIDTEADFFIAQVIYYHLNILGIDPDELNKIPYIGIL